MDEAPEKTWPASRHALRNCHAWRLDAIITLTGHKNDWTCLFILPKERSCRFSDESILYSFLGDVPIHQEIIAEFEQRNR